MHGPATSPWTSVNGGNLQPGDYTQVKTIRPYFSAEISESYLVMKNMRTGYILITILINTMKIVLKILCTSLLLSHV